MEHGDSFLSILRLPKQFAISLLWAAPLYVLAFLVLLLFAAGIYVRAAADHGTWMAIGSWSLLVFYVVVGLATGVAAGILSSVHGLLTSIESALHTGFRHLPAFTQNPEPAPLSLDEARIRYATLVDRLLNQVLGYVPLPGWLDGKVRSWIQDAIVTEFITLCRDRGMTSIPPQEFRNWLLAQGATLALSPLHDQISLWQYALFGLIGLLAGGTLLLAYFIG
jgi:hypothetical protein